MSEVLPSCTNSKNTEKRVLSAARKHFHKRAGINAVFEHGHWWVIVGCHTYDVVDAEGPGTVNGFDFEGVD
jgi:hypothetical protein